MTLKTDFYFLSPVEVVRVTPKNLEEVAAWCGGKVAETESRRVEGRMDKYVWVPTPKGSAISWAFPGMFITKRVVITEHDEVKVTYSVFRKDYFNKNYFENPAKAVEDTWDRQAREAGKLAHPSAANPIEMASRAVKTPEGFVAVADVSPNEPVLTTGPLNDVVTPEVLPLVEEELKKAGSNMVQQREILSEAAVDTTPLVGVQYRDAVKTVAQLETAIARWAAQDPHRA